MIVPTQIFAVLAVALVAGVANALPPQKIVGGTAAALGEFPYQISLRVGSQHICGGTIITKRHIITAAHCVIGVSTSRFRVATGTISSTGGQIHTISKIVPHPSYDNSRDDSPNDIAIITLSADITFNANQNKLDLPTSATPAGVTAIATGWGYTSALIQRINPSLFKVELNTLSNAQCNRIMGGIYENQICAYISRGRGVCNGDSGGPLAYNGQLIGLVSYGIPCGLGYPDVFTSVYHHLSWINQYISD